MNICFVCSEYPPAPHGGVGSVVQLLGRALARHGHHVCAVGMYSQTEPLRVDHDEGVEIRRLQIPAGRLGWVAARYRLFREVKRLVREGRCDLVELPDHEGWAAGWPVLGVPVVVRLHGSYSYFSSEMGMPVPQPLFWFERASLRRADFCCSTSRYAARRTRELFGLPRSDAAVLYNPVEAPESFPAAERHPKRVVFTGTLTPKKGIQSLIAAWPEVVRRIPGAELHIFGKDGVTAEQTSMRQRLTQQLNGSASSVCFHGHCPRETVLKALETAQAAAFPSYAEAFAMAPLESMAHGCATIYTNRGSGPECIENGADGMLIDPGNPAAIAEALVRVLADRALAQRLGRNGWRRVKQSFSVPALLGRNEDFYGRCVDQFRRSAC